MSVPFLDLRRQYREIQEEVDSSLRALLDEQSFILGETVERFEQDLARYHELEHGVGVASGTDALLLSLMTIDLEDGDEVVTSPFTFFATAGAIHNAGGRPVFADIDPDTFNLSPAKVERAITSRTRAIVPVHLFGQMAEMDAMRELAEAHDLFVVEDAAQAVGARRRVDGSWRHPGSVGDCAALSFYPAKNLGGFGDGGMVLTDSAKIAEGIRRLRVHGGRKMYHHEEVGLNSRLDALQAAVLHVKLEHLDAWNEARAANAAWYGERFEELEAAGHVRRPRVDSGAEHVWHQYTIRVEGRDSLREHLDDRGIGTGVYYPVPLHLQPCFSHLDYQEGDFPEAERAAREVVALPVFPELTEQERAEVADAVEAFYR